MRIFRAVSAALCGFLLAGCATVSARPVSTVMVEVDFGPAGRSLVRQVVPVEPGATLQDATAMIFPVEKGSVCCDPRETAAIDGVAADPAANLWWTVSVNGSKKVSPYKTRLKPGDRVRWEYRRYDQ